MVDTISNPEDNDFIVAKTKKKHRTEPKGKPGKDYKAKETEFEPTTVDKVWSSEPLPTQIRNTVTFLEQKKMRIGNQIFYIVYPKVVSSSSEIKKALRRLDANVIAFLDKNNNRALVEASNQQLYQLSGRKIPLYLEQSLRMIRPLLPEEQISSEIRKGTKQGSKMVVINLVPNLEKEKLQGYSNKILEYLESKKCKIYQKDLTDEGLIFADADLQTLEDLVNDSTFIFQVNAVPQSLAQKIRKRFSTKLKKKFKVVANVSSHETSTGQRVELPVVVVMDSGLNVIPQLQGLILARYGDNFPNPDDSKPNDGHGTPIAYLAAFGEDGIEPEAKVISYKIWSPEINYLAYDGMLNGIRRFSNKTKLFVTSVCFTKGLDDNLKIKLERMVQSENVCLVCSAGNIDNSDIVSSENSGHRYPKYLRRFAIFPPADLASIIGVGSITKRANQDSVLNPNLVSMHSRCGTSNRFLFDCQKPEVVEHGGNMNRKGNRFDSVGVGVRSVNKIGQLVDHLTGTSFSSPLFINKLAAIEGKYGRLIKNSETLKALAIISCRIINSECSGFGEPQKFLNCDRDHALYFAEGEILLPDKTGRNNEIYYDQISGIIVPAGIERIDICLVHSDNFARKLVPSLNTYLKIKAWKTGSNSPVSPMDKDIVNLKTNTKTIAYSFKRRSMEATWRFEVFPELTADLPSAYEKEIEVRYGCAILLTRKSSHSSIYSVNEEINL